MVDPTPHNYDEYELTVTSGDAIHVPEIPSQATQQEPIVLQGLQQPFRIGCVRGGAEPT